MAHQEWAFYALPPSTDIPYEHVGHFIKGEAPDGAREIDKDEARRILAHLSTHNQDSSTDGVHAEALTPDAAALIALFASDPQMSVEQQTALVLEHISKSPNTRVLNFRVE